MRKEKLHIPMPDEGMIEKEIQQIVALGVKRKESFFQFIKSMIQQVGMRHLISDRSELHFILIIAMTSLSIFVIQPNLSVGSAQNLYAYIFLISPLFFLVFSIYTYVTKIKSATYEVEMACKYNVYQILGFRMLAFSVLTILVNTGTIVAFMMLYENVQFMRAFMISTTGLFLFSVLFLYVLTKRGSTFTAAFVVVGWLVTNLLLKGMNEAWYSEILFNMPLFVYALVLVGSLFVYVHNLKKLIQIKQVEGAF